VEMQGKKLKKKKKKQEICLKIRVAPIDEKRIDGESLEMI
jgi:hypothetical protein